MSLRDLVIAPIIEMQRAYKYALGTEIDVTIDVRAAAYTQLLIESSPMGIANNTNIFISFTLNSGDGTITVRNQGTPP